MTSQLPGRKPSAIVWVKQSFTGAVREWNQHWSCWNPTWMQIHEWNKVPPDSLKFKYMKGQRRHRWRAQIIKWIWTNLPCRHDVSCWPNVAHILHTQTDCQPSVPPKFRTFWHKLHNWSCKRNKHVGQVLPIVRPVLPLFSQRNTKI